MPLDMEHWFETHLTESENTGVFKRLSEAKRETILSKLGLPISEVPIMYSMLDVDNFLILTSKRLLWRCDGKSDEINLDKVVNVGHAGGIRDSRYEGTKWRYYEDGRIVSTNEPPDLDKHTGDRYIRTGSPLMFIESQDGVFKEMKAEPGHYVETIAVGIIRQKGA